MERIKRLVGPDRVTLQGLWLFIDSAADMPDWYAREYRRVAIIYEGYSYYVVEKKLIGARRYQYTLALWPEGSTDLPGKIIEYDAEYARLRDEITATIKRANQINVLLTPLRPILGLLPAFIKIKLEENYGIDRWDSTHYSLYLETLAILCLAVLLVIEGYAGNLFSAPLLAMEWIYLYIMVLIPDLVLRWDGVMRQSQAYGFYEWVITAIKVSLLKLQR
jgi:hypothetical protein